MKHQIGRADLWHGWTRLAKKECARNVYAQHCITEVRYYRAQIKQVMKEMREWIEKNSGAEIVEKLCGIPGVGVTTAMTYYSEIMDMDRFKRLDQLASFVGLIPSTRSSGDTERHGRLTSRSNRYLRYLIIEAAWMAIRKDPGMLASFAELTKRMKKQQAIIRIARKLLSRIRYVWQNKQDYVLGVIA